MQQRVARVQAGFGVRLHHRPGSRSRLRPAHCPAQADDEATLVDQGGEQAQLVARGSAARFVLAGVAPLVVRVARGLPAAFVASSSQTPAPPPAAGVKAGPTVSFHQAAGCARGLPRFPIPARDLQQQLAQRVRMEYRLGLAVPRRESPSPGSSQAR